MITVAWLASDQSVRIMSLSQKERERLWESGRGRGEGEKGSYFFLQIFAL